MNPKEQGSLESRARLCQSLLDLEDSLWRREGGGKAGKAQSSLVSVPEGASQSLVERPSNIQELCDLFLKSVNLSLFLYNHQWLKHQRSFVCFKDRRKEACPRTVCDKHRGLWTAGLRPPRWDLLSCVSQVYAKKVAPLAVNKTRPPSLRMRNVLPFLASVELEMFHFLISD